MLLVLDSNEYIFGFGASKKPASVKLLDFLGSSSPVYSIRLPRLIIEEVRPRLSREEFKEFIAFISDVTSIDEDFVVPFELGSKYEAMGFKPADAFIAAYVEWVGADAVVSENRHFLARNPHVPFKVLNAENCLKFMTASLQ